MDSKLTRRIVFAAVAAGAVLAPTRQSQAQTLAVATGVITFTKSVFGFVKTGKKLVGPSAKEIAAQLTMDLRDALFETMTTARNQAWKVDVNNVFEGFIYLAQVEEPEMPANTGFLSHYIIEVKELMDSYAQVVKDGDIESSYQGAPAFNALVAIYVALNRLNPVFNPTTPVALFTWDEYNTQLSLAMKVNYSLIGSEHYTCWPGSNPGAGGYSAHNDPGNYNSRLRSLLYRKVADRDVQVGTWTGLYQVRIPGAGCAGYTVTAPRYCNPYRGTCSPIYNGQIPFDGCPVSQVFPTTPADTSFGVQLARQYAEAGLLAQDPVFQVVTAGMTAIMGAGGGDSSIGSNRGYPVIGWLTDPQVPEPACGAGTAYPTIVTTALPTPTAFVDGYLKEEDYRNTNIFPHSELKMQETSEVARSGVFNTSSNRNYALVIRYRQGHATAGRVKVGIQQAGSGATLKIFSNVSFDPTPGDTWQLMRLNFSTGSNFPSQSYVRLQFLGGDITYFDAVWVMDQ